MNNIKRLIIYDFKDLSNILKEIKKELNFIVEDLKLEEINKIDDQKFYLIINKKNIPNVKNQLTLNNLPIKISKLVEKINIEFLKTNFHDQSETKIGKYVINLNSREMCNKKTILKLTEKEVNIILFLANFHAPTSINKLQNEVWGYQSDLETHTVETHIYRLRKKFYLNLEMTTLLLVKSKDIKLPKRKNYVAKNLFSKRYKSKIVMPKKGKGSFKRKKIKF